ncbi:MAG: LD-carboxypeptidase [Cyanobacteria bacterium SW_4_48_29]|jgi:muramoyltetrapeptide carboxypeptidase|nr:MAG: LD-carboxypeptidase [Cyanobacteria bacterium SW_4_48_29]
MTKKYYLQLPPPLKPGDLLRVVAPSGALREWEALEKGVEIWRARGYQIQLDGHFDSRCGYLAGGDAQRRKSLAQAWQDPDCKGILCLRGGYGSARLLEDWRWGDGNSKFKVQNSKLINLQPSNPKWLIGFSDATGLLWSLAQVGISGVHAPVITTLAAEPDWSIQRLLDCVEGRPLASLTGRGWGKGKAGGILLPANLTVATHLLGTPMQPYFDGVILALEDVTEVPYRIDRMLTQWRLCGAFEGVRGIALGRFSRCYAPEGVPSWSVEEVLRDRLADLNIPIISDLPFGHDGANAALPVGQPVQLDADKGTLSWG